MSAETTSELEDAFRDLLLEISQKMNSNNPSELAFAAKCSECSGRSALDVLEELMRLGEFSATAPGNLANLLLRIKRKDLADLVKTFREDDLASFSEKRHSSTQKKGRELKKSYTTPQLRHHQESTSMRLELKPRPKEEENSQLHCCTSSCSVAPTNTQKLEFQLSSQDCISFQEKQSDVSHSAFCPSSNPCSQGSQEVYRISRSVSGSQENSFYLQQTQLMHSDTRAQDRLNEWYCVSSSSLSNSARFDTSSMLSEYGDSRARSLTRKYSQGSPKSKPRAIPRKRMPSAPPSTQNDRNYSRTKECSTEVVVPPDHYQQEEERQPAIIQHSQEKHVPSEEQTISHEMPIPSEENSPLYALRGPSETSSYAIPEYESEAEQAKLGTDDEDSQKSLPSSLKDKSLFQRTFSFMRRRENAPHTGTSCALSFMWKLGRMELFKPVIEHQEQLTINRPGGKLELNANRGKYNPKLSFQLYPYGLFKDKGTAVTMTVRTKISDKCMPLPPSAKISLKLVVWSGEGKARKEVSKFPAVTEKMSTSVFHIYTIMTHDQLKQSKCKHYYLEVEIKSRGTDYE